MHCCTIHCNRKHCLIAYHLAIVLHPIHNVQEIYRQTVITTLRLMEQHKAIELKRDRWERRDHVNRPRACCSAVDPPLTSEHRALRPQDTLHRGPCPPGQHPAPQPSPTSTSQQQTQEEEHGSGPHPSGGQRVSPLWCISSKSRKACKLDLTSNLSVNSDFSFCWQTLPPRECSSFWAPRTMTRSIFLMTFSQRWMKSVWGMERILSGGKVPGADKTITTLTWRLTHSRHPITESLDWMEQACRPTLS